METLSGTARGSEGPWIGSCLEGQLSHNVLQVSPHALPPKHQQTMKTCLKTDFGFWKLIQYLGFWKVRA